MGKTALIHAPAWSGAWILVKIARKMLLTAPKSVLTACHATAARTPTTLSALALTNVLTSSASRNALAAVLTARVLIVLPSAHVTTTVLIGTVTA